MLQKTNEHTNHCTHAVNYMTLYSNTAMLGTAKSKSKSKQC